jgi:hypothetical protein
MVLAVASLITGTGLIVDSLVRGRRRRHGPLATSDIRPSFGPTVYVPERRGLCPETVARFPESPRKGD